MATEKDFFTLMDLIDEYTQKILEAHGIALEQVKESEVVTIRLHFIDRLFQIMEPK